MLDDDHCMVLAPDPYIDLVARNNAEKHAPFSWALSMLCAAKGFPVAVPRRDNGADMELTAARGEITEEDKTGMTDTVTALLEHQSDLDYLTTSEAALKAQIERQDTTADDKRLHSLTKVLLNYCNVPQPAQPLTAPDVEFAADNNQQIYNMAALLRASDERLLSADDQNLFGKPARVGWADITGRTILGVRQNINDALVILGWDDLHDVNRAIDLPTLSPDVIDRLSPFMLEIEGLLKSNLSRAKKTSEGLMRRMGAALKKFVGMRIVRKGTNRGLKSLENDERVTRLAARSVFFREK